MMNGKGTFALDMLECMPVDVKSSSVLGEKKRRKNTDWRAKPE